MIDPRDPAPHHYEWKGEDRRQAPQTSTGGVIAAAVLVLLLLIVFVSVMAAG